MNISQPGLRFSEQINRYALCCSVWTCWFVFIDYSLTWLPSRLCWPEADIYFYGSLLRSPLSPSGSGMSTPFLSWKRLASQQKEELLLFLKNVTHCSSISYLYKLLIGFVSHLLLLLLSFPFLFLLFLFPFLFGYFADVY